MTIHEAQLILARQWSIGAILIFCLVAWIGLGNGQGLTLKLIYGWMAPHIAPTLTAILVTGPIRSSLSGTRNTGMIPRTEFAFLYWGSLFYFVILLGTLVAHPFVKSETLEYFQSSKYWLGPVQTIVLGMLGLLFKGIATRHE